MVRACLTDTVTLLHGIYQSVLCEIGTRLLLSDLDRTVNSQTGTSSLLGLSDTEHVLSDALKKEVLVLLPVILGG